LDAIETESHIANPRRLFAVMAYMEMFGNCSHQNNNEFLRHSVHTYNLLQAEWQQQEMSLTSTQSCSFSMVSSQSNQVFPAHGNIALNNIEVGDPGNRTKSRST
jgi:hypothetical protein